MLATGAAGTSVLHRRIPARLAAGAVPGSIAIGFGARIAYGYNIGAYFGGIASFSLHGWLWAGAALVGTLVGLRPIFGPGVPKPCDSSCRRSPGDGRRPRCPTGSARTVRASSGQRQKTGGERRLGQGHDRARAVQASSERGTDDEQIRLPKGNRTSADQPCRHRQQARR